MVKRKKASKEELTAIYGIEWVMVECKNRDGKLIPALMGKDVTASFREDGVLNGSAGCNRYMGKFTFENDVLKVGPLASTMMYCPEPGIMEQEYDFLRAMQSVMSFRFDGEQLLMLDASNETAIIFKK